MNWLFFALMPPVLYAFTNHLDKFLLSKYFKGGQVGSLILFSSLFSVFALPVIYFFDSSVFSIGFLSILILTFNGFLSIIALIFYFYALEKEETSIVVPFMQTIPVISFILGYFILGEKLNAKEVFACFLILLGTVIISLEFKEKIKLKWNIIFLMLCSSFFFAVSIVIFKMVAINSGFCSSLFWEFSGKILFGSLIFVFIKSYRKQFLEVFKINRGPVMALNSLNEIIFIFADAILYYATLLAPVALVSTINGTQPFFVLVIGIMITIFFPKFGKESLDRFSLIQKTAAIILIVYGTFLISNKI